MELTKFLGLLAVVLPVAYGAPTSATANLHPEILAAMKRDLGLDAAEATAVVAREVKAVDVIEQLRNKSGKSFAGAWVADGGKTINVAVTDKSLAKEVTAAGAQPTVVANSHERLQEAKAALDKVAKEQVKSLDASSDSGVAAWYVDVKTNKVVLEALSSKHASAKSLAKKAKLAESEYEVRTVEKMPTTFASIQGGDAYIIGNARCSVGFSVTTGYVSAGHCGQAGAATTTQDGEALGQFEASVFPGDADMSYISTVDGTTLNPTVNGYGGDGVTITGNTVAAIGASICRSGSTSGVHCGTVKNYEASVNYSEGIVTGLTETDACAEPGDSGGSFYAGDQAQGVTSGGSGDCTSGGTTYFQPVNEILDTYGLTLVTG